MLKKRTKTFAPSKVGPRKAGLPSSTPSSARPSVEPRGKSQTPAPTQTQPESAVLEAQAPANVSTASVSQSVESTSRSASQEGVRGQSVAQSPEPAASTSNTNPKRTTREDDTAELPAKRINVDVGQAVTSAPEITITPAAATATEVPIDEHILQNNVAQEHNSNLLKRKAAEDHNLQPAAKRISPSPETQSTGAQDAPDSTTTTPSRNQSTISTTNVHTPIVESSQILPSIETPQASANSLPTPQTQRTALPSTSNPLPIPERQRSASESQDVTPEPPSYRYPSPDRVAPIPGQVSVTPGRESLGPPGGGAAVPVGPIAGPGLVIPATLNPDGSSSTVPILDAAVEPAQAKKPKRKYTKKKKVPVLEGDAEIDVQLSAPAERQKGRKKKGKKSKKREDTPEGAEDEEIDPTIVTMNDLCSDLKIGKKFKRHDEIKQRLEKKKAEMARKKWLKDHPELVSLVEGEEGAEPQEGEAGPSGSNEDGTNDDNGESSTPAPVIGSGPKMRIVDGHLVLDESSLQIDRHKRAGIDSLITKTVEENEFSKIVTSGSYMKRVKSQQWDDEEMHLFYKGLRMFGTDFQMISKLFKTRNRRQIKLKFNSEEKKNPKRITKALTGQKDDIDVEEYTRLSGETLVSVETITAEHDAFEAEQNAELDRIAAAQAEETRQKKATIHGGKSAAQNLLDRVELSDEDGEQPGSSAKENSDPRSKGKGKGKAKAKPRKNKNKHSMHGGGEEVIVDGRID